MCETCRELLNEALNLAVRSDQFEAQSRRRAALAASVDGSGWETSGRFADYVERHNISYPHSQIAVCGVTQHIWVQDQYDRDLFDWQEKARAHLMAGCGDGSK